MEQVMVSEPTRYKTFVQLPRGAIVLLRHRQITNDRRFVQDMSYS